MGGSTCSSMNSLQCHPVHHTQALSDLGNFISYRFRKAVLKLKKKNNIFLKRKSSYSLRKGAHNESKVAEEYCWAVTNSGAAMLRGFNVLEFGFHL
jgi:hypothetical protein